jgi:hypothetical protein
LHLDIDRLNLDALESDCGDALDHVPPLALLTVAEASVSGDGRNRLEVGHHQRLRATIPIANHAD